MRVDWLLSVVVRFRLRFLSHEQAIERRMVCCGSASDVGAVHSTLAGACCCCVLAELPAGTKRAIEVCGLFRDRGSGGALCFSRYLVSGLCIEQMRDYRPNEPPAVDAGMSPLFGFSDHWPGTTEAER